MKLANSQKLNYKPSFGIKFDYSAQTAVKEAFKNKKSDINAIELALQVLGHEEILIGASHKTEKAFGCRVQGLGNKNSLIKTMVNFIKNSYTDIYEQKHFYAYFKGNKKAKMPLFDICWYQKENRFGQVFEKQISEYPEELKIKLCNIDKNIKQKLKQNIVQQRFEKLNS